MMMWLTGIQCDCCPGRKARAQKSVMAWKSTQILGGCSARARTVYVIVLGESVGCMGAQDNSSSASCWRSRR